MCFKSSWLYFIYKFNKIAAVFSCKNNECILLFIFFTNNDVHVDCDAIKLKKIFISGDYTNIKTLIGDIFYLGQLHQY